MDRQQLLALILALLMLGSASLGVITQL